MWALMHQHGAYPRHELYNLLFFNAPNTGLRLACVKSNNKGEIMKKRVSTLLLASAWFFNAIASEPFSIPVAMDAKSGGTNYVNATLGETVTASFLLDTGSGMLVVNQDTFSALKKQSAVTFSHDAAARLANGKLHKVKIYTVSNFRIGEHCELGQVEVAVIKKGNNILGMSALSKAAPFAISVNPPTLMLSECGQTMTASINRADN